MDGTPKLYIGSPMTIVSARRSSSMRASDSATIARCAALRSAGFARNAWKRSAVRCGRESRARSRVRIRPDGFSSRQAATNCAARRLDCPALEKRLVSICSRVFMVFSVVFVGLHWALYRIDKKAQNIAVFNRINR